MESNRKRRGFMKGKLMPFYRAGKSSSSSSSSSSSVQYSSKVVKQSQTSPSTASVGFLVQKEYMMAQPKQKVSFLLPENSRENLVQLETLYGHGDEGVDIKAASYISSVQERFKLERINSERVKCQEMR